MLQIPIHKNNKYVSQLETPVHLFITDVKIKSLFRFNNDKGYLLNIFIQDSINHDIITKLQQMDKDTFDTILQQSGTWFNKSFTKEDLQLLYEPSFCSQSSTISLILSNDVLTKCTFNEKPLDTIEELINIFKNSKKLKECLINLHIYHHGLYFYKEKAVAKWFIKQVNITETSYEKCYWIKEDVEDKLYDNILQLKKKINNKIAYHKESINKIESALKDIENEFANIHQQNKNKNWMDALDKLNKRIILLEDSSK